MDFLDSWGSYVPEEDGGLSGIRKLLSEPVSETASPPLLKLVDQDTVKTTKDEVQMSTNRATITLMKAASKTKTVAAPLESAHRKQVEENASKKRPVKTMKVEPEAAEVEDPKRARATRVVPEPTATQVRAIETLEQHNVRDNEAALFAERIEAQSLRPSNALIINQPPSAKVLADYRKYTTDPVWTSFSRLQTQVAVEGLHYPDVPAFNRAYLQYFLREPIGPYERPCLNLDKPCSDGRVFECIAHQMSTRQLGVGKGFRLREFLMKDESVRINNAIEQKHPNPLSLLNPVPELCMLCHLWTAFHAATDQRDGADERERRNMTDDTNPTVMIINRFMVMVDKLGEYDRHRMLTSDKISMGIWGPFPLFNENNYIAIPRSAAEPARRFQETDNLLYHEE